MHDDVEGQAKYCRPIMQGRQGKIWVLDDL